MCLYTVVANSIAALPRKQVGRDISISAVQTTQSIDRTPICERTSKSGIAGLSYLGRLATRLRTPLYVLLRMLVDFLANLDHI